VNARMNMTRAALLTFDVMSILKPAGYRVDPDGERQLWEADADFGRTYQAVLFIDALLPGSSRVVELRFSCDARVGRRIAHCWASITDNIRLQAWELAAAMEGIS